MTEDSIFSRSYQKVLKELQDLNSEERLFSDSDNSWKIELTYFYKFNHLQLEFVIKPLNTSIDYPRFDLYRRPMKILGFLKIGLYTTHMDGKISDLSDHFCELKSTDFLLNQTDVHFGWDGQSVTYLAKMNKKQVENLIHIFNCIEFTCKHTAPMLEVI